MTNSNNDLTKFLDNNKAKDVAAGKAAQELKLIIPGYRIRNSALREFVYIYRYSKKMSDHDILELVMALDELVENEKLDDDKLDLISKDPKAIND